MKRTCNWKDCPICREAVERQTIATDSNGTIHAEEGTTEIETEMARQSIGDQESWVRGYDKGYKAGRDGELKRIEELINKYLKGKL